ncbi:MAG: T9SS type A sorting domain-containing protein [Segatella sp.]
MNAIDIPGAHEIEITISQTTLRVTGGAGQVLYIYNVAGVCVMSLRVDSNDKRFDLNLAKGCYIVKVGRTVRKVSIH